jgi:hypothetical protein
MEFFYIRQMTKLYYKILDIRRTNIGKNKVKNGNFMQSPREIFQKYGNSKIVLEFCIHL